MWTAIRILILVAIATYLWLENNGVEIIHARRYDPPPAPIAQAQAQPPQNGTDQWNQMWSPNGGTSQSRVILYTTSWCGQCKAAKAFLNARGVPYDERDVERSREWNLEYGRLGGHGVPFAVIDGTTKLTGFSPDYYAHALGL